MVEPLLLLFLIANGEYLVGHGSRSVVCDPFFFSECSFIHTPNKRTTTPMEMDESAILKTGKFPIEIKSVTFCINRRSIRLPAAPPSCNPMANRKVQSLS